MIYKTGLFVSEWFDWEYAKIVRRGVQGNQELKEFRFFERNIIYIVSDSFPPKDIFIELIHDIFNVEFELSEFLLTELICCLLAIEEIDPALNDNCSLEICGHVWVVV